MSDSGLKTLTGSARLAVVDEAPAGSVNKFQFTPNAKLWVSTCEVPFVSERQSLESFRRLVDKIEETE